MDELENLLETWRSVTTLNQTAVQNDKNAGISESLSYLHGKVDEIVREQKKEQDDYEKVVVDQVCGLIKFIKDNNFAQSDNI